MACAHTHTHTHMPAPSHPSVSERAGCQKRKYYLLETSRCLLKMSRFSQTETTSRGGVCFRGRSPENRPCRCSLSRSPLLGPGWEGGIPTCGQCCSQSQGSQRPHAPSSGQLLRVQEREGPASESPLHFRRAFELSLPPTSEAWRFHIRLLFLSLLPLPRESSPGSGCRPSSHPKLSPIH